MTLIEEIEELIAYTTPGFLFIAIVTSSIYNETNAIFAAILGIPISNMIRSFYSLISKPFPNLSFPDPVKELIYIVTGLIAGIAFIKLLDCIYFVFIDREKRKR